MKIKTIYVPRYMNETKKQCEKTVSQQINDSLYDEYYTTKESAEIELKDFYIKGIVGYELHLLEVKKYKIKKLCFECDNIVKRFDYINNKWGKWCSYECYDKTMLKQKREENKSNG